MSEQRPVNRAIALRKTCQSASARVTMQRDKQWTQDCQSLAALCFDDGFSFWLSCVRYIMARPCRTDQPPP